MRNWKSRRSWSGLSVIVLIGMWLSPVIETRAADEWRAKPKPNESDQYFQKGEISEIRIDISEPEMQKLRQANRSYVRATISENGQQLTVDAGVKLKGAAGSFRGVDDRPALTINMDKFAAKNVTKKSFHGLEKFHLNNSVQDPSYLNELVCSDLFLAAGVPAARVSHARVWFNNRDLGFYVLKEGFDSTFLKRHFASHKGNLYDGGFLQEIDAKLEKDQGDGPDDHSDLAALVAALRHPKPEERWPTVSRQLNVDQFLSFLGLEIFTCHWDGYCRNRNNYRVYFDPTSKQAFFFPHGMDQMFGDPGGSLQERGGSLVSQTLLQNPEWNTAYRQRLRDLQSLLVPPDKVLKRIDDVAARMNPVLAKIHPDQAREHSNRVRELKDRITARSNSIRDQIRAEPIPLAFNAQGESAPIPDWVEKMESGTAKLESLPGPPKQLSIDTVQVGNTVASWRTGVLLAPGRYKFVGRAKAVDLQPTESPSGRGAGLRVSGLQRMNQVSGTVDWTALEFPFDVDSLKRVDLVIELRATKGRVLFDADSLKIIKVKTP